MNACTRLWPTPQKRLPDETVDAILRRFGNDADRRHFERLAQRDAVVNTAPQPKTFNTAISGQSWAARSEPLLLAHRATRSHGRSAYEIQLPQGPVALEAGRHQLPILMEADLTRQIGACTIQGDGSALVRFSQSAEGVNAERAFAMGHLRGELAYLSRKDAAPVPAAISLKTVKSDSILKDNSIMSDNLEIVALGQRHNKMDAANNAIANGKSLDQFRNELLEALATSPLDNSPISHFVGEQRTFSLTKLIHAEINNDYSGAGFEREMVQEAARSYNGKARGIVIPAFALASRASMLMGGDAAGAVGNTLLGDAYIDALRPASSVMAAGATVFNGLGSNVSIPKNTGDLTAAWVAEGATIDESDIAVATLDMTPKMVAGRASFTRHLLATSTPAIDELVRQGLVKQIANAIDLAALQGSGVSPIPLGVSNTTGVNTVSAAGATLTWAEALDAMAEVASANLDSTAGAWIVNPLDAAKLGQATVDAGSGKFVMEAGAIAGRRVIESSHATQGTLYFGLWQHAYIGLWQGLDLIIDPYTDAKKGVVNIVASQLADVTVAHAPAFTIVTTD